MDGVVVISSDSDDDDIQDDPFLFPGDRDEHRRNTIHDDEVQVPEDLDFAEGRIVQQRFIYGLAPDLRSQLIFKEILQGTLSFIVYSVVCLSVWVVM